MKTKTRSKPATRLDPGHKLKTTDSETEIVQRLKSVAVGMDFFLWLFRGLWDEDETNLN